MRFPLLCCALLTLALACGPTPGTPPAAAPGSSSQQTPPATVGTSSASPGAPLSNAGLLPAVEPVAYDTLQDAKRFAFGEHQRTTARLEGTELIVELRALQSRLAVGDSLQLALSWRPRKGPVTRREQMRVAPDRPLTLTLSGPGGEQTLEVGERPIAGRTGYAFWLELGKPPLAIPEPQPRGSLPMQPWGGDLSRAGRYQLRVRGSLTVGGKPTAFELGPLAFQVSPEALTRAQRLAQASKSVSGLTRPRGLGNICLELADGHTLVLLRGQSHRMSTGYACVRLTPGGAVVGVSRRTHFHCVAAGTPIATPAGPRPIERLAIGDRVIACDPTTGLRSVVRILDIRRGRAPNTLRIGHARFSPAHPLRTERGWREAGDLGPSPRVFHRDGTLRPVQPLPAGPADVFDLTVEPPHTFFAGGWLVHNKRKIRGPEDHPFYILWPELLAQPDR